MESKEEILQQLFGSMPNFVSEVHCYNRNLISIYSIGKKKIIIKEFKNAEFLEREKFFYKFLKNFCKIPEIYYAGDNFIITDFIESKESNLIGAVRDWAKIHSSLLEDKVLTNSLIFSHEPLHISGYVYNNGELFQSYGKKMEGILSKKRKIEEPVTIIHGDLFDKNILFDGIDNNYIDFEFCGKGHPVKDLSLIILNHPEMDREVIKTYREQISFDYEEIENDIKLELLNKGVRLICGLKYLKMPLDLKQKMYNKFMRVLKKYFEDS